ncbi:flagellum-specific peptidoglycan hydrolase FlgJ [Gillisia sp. Hel_I_86]|uniref:glucosaminidase domain-containing protein n=1 Tax=Gillisia sp. Hel_I_86 TaxID=1249981 RepID=UPI00119BFA83|nr:glucosaminidase domain-containing protein [Gillisia sp. Hel_I_86]TVZ28585.1 flagellum-specific peptidoglycan hydrolase FlgJ [Gillisia sp. Hel_I_86]
MYKIKLHKLFIGLFLLLFLASCGSKKKVASKRDNQSATRTESAPRGSYANVVENYVAKFAVIAQEEMRLYKIPASITLAQGILESGAGKGELTRRANNHFGIKCHDWEGDKVYHDDDRSKECFRKYNDPKYSYRDHSLFLSQRRRYADLFKLDPDDYEAWAKGLRAAGYATDRMYPRKLIDLVERYNLDRFDSEVLGKTYKSDRKKVVAQTNGSNSYIVQKGDTLYSIAKRNNTSVETLQKINNLPNTNIAIGQELIVESTSN